MKETTSRFIRECDWKSAAASASSLSELLLTLGDVSSAVRQGEQSVESSDRSDDTFWKLGSRTTLAAALFCAGVEGRAEGGDETIPQHFTTVLVAFGEAEAMQQERQPQYPLLYSLAGYRYCAILLADLCLRIGNLRARFAGAALAIETKQDQAHHSVANTGIGSTEFPWVYPTRRHANRDKSHDLDRAGHAAYISNLQSEIKSLRNRAKSTLKQHGHLSILSAAQDHLTLGRTWQLSARLDLIENLTSSSHVTPYPPLQASGVAGGMGKPAIPTAGVFTSQQQAELHLTQSVTLRRQSGQQDELPAGLLHRAALWRELLTLAPFLLPDEAQSEDEAIVCPEGGISGPDSPSHTSPDFYAQGERDFYALADRDLSEAESIAERGSMLIWQIEAALERSQLYLTLHDIGWEGEAPAESQTGEASQAGSLRHVTNGSAGASPSRWLELAREKLAETKELITKTEKPYEPHVPDWEEWEPPEYVGVFKPGQIVGYHCRNEEIRWLEEALENA